MSLSRNPTSGTIPGALVDTSVDSGAHVTADRVQDAVSHGLAVVLAE